jgi:sodium-dependent dicarboxylate transporter 2/3/5
LRRFRNKIIVFHALTRYNIEMSSTTIPNTIADETSPTTRKVGYFLGPLLFVFTLFSGAPEGMDANAWRVCGLAMWMGTWWVTEAMPLPVSSLLPLVLLPIFTDISFKNTASPYSSGIIFLLLGGFMLSIAMEKWNLHMRTGLGILRIMGRGPKSILGGMMLATAFMGMWISNTACAIMMLPMAISIALLFCGKEKGCETDNNPFAKAMILGVAYASVVGGLSTFVGTPTNAILIGFMSKTYGFEFSLADWMSFGVPLALIILFMVWGLITFIFLRHHKIEGDVRDMVKTAYTNLGPMRREEKIVAAIFATTATLWAGSSHLENLLQINIDDAAIAIFAALLLFTVPTTAKFDQFALTWKDTSKLPWGILVFFGGSLCISDALTASGVTQWLSIKLGMLEGLNIVIIVAVVIVLLIAVSEMMSNVATVTAFLPILSAMAVAMGVNPLIVLIPATLAASCGFMLPGASAPNAFAYGTGYLKIKDMVRTGFMLDLIAGLIVLLFTFTFISWIFGIDPHIVPEWAIK